MKTKTLKVKWVEDANGDISIEIDDGSIYAPMTEGRAKEIVRAVNTHQELVEGLKHIQGWLKDKYTSERDGTKRAGFANFVEFCDEVLAKAEASAFESQTKGK